MKPYYKKLSKVYILSDVPAFYSTSANSQICSASAELDKTICITASLILPGDLGISEISYPGNL